LAAAVDQSMHVTDVGPLWTSCRVRYVSMG
jgi:hypothetical protein